MGCIARLGRSHLAHALRVVCPAVDWMSWCSVWHVCFVFDW